MPTLKLLNITINNCVCRNMFKNLYFCADVQSTPLMKGWVYQGRLIQNQLISLNCIIKDPGGQISLILSLCRIKVNMKYKSKITKFRSTRKYTYTKISLCNCNSSLMSSISPNYHTQLSETQFYKMYFFHPTLQPLCPAGLHMRQSKARFVEYMQTVYISNTPSFLPPTGESTGRKQTCLCEGRGFYKQL